MCIRGEGLCTTLDIHSDTNPRVFSAYNSHSWGLTFRDFTIDQTHALTNPCMFAAGHGAIAITASLTSASGVKYASNSWRSRVYATAKDGAGQPGVIATSLLSMYKIKNYGGKL